ncbi:MAG: FecR domain-containing protein [Lautropia sp.]|nr:FecR domain-containing protein [Lautropia sp.]
MLLGGFLFAGSAWANDVRLILVAGEVQLQRAVPGQPVRTLVPVNGAPVLPGDILVTGTTGRLQLRFSDGSLVSLQPQSEFRIDGYRFDLEQQRGFFSLVRGALRTISGAVGKRDPADYRMTTPTATIGIRGTEFLVEETVCTPACYPGRTAGLRVAVSAGRVVVYNQAGSIEVPAGGATYVADPSRSPVPTSDRPTMSTAPASVDPANPASTTRVASLAPAAVERAAGGSGLDVSAAMNARTRGSKQSPVGATPANALTGDENETAEDTGRPAQPTLPNTGEGMPPELVAQWSAGKNEPVATVAFDRPTAPLASTSLTGGLSGRAATGGVLVAGLPPSGAGAMPPPVGDATGTNTQRDTAGLPVAIGAVGAASPGGLPGGGSNGAGGSAGSGTRAGTEASGSTDTGGMGGGNAGGGNTGGGDPGGGTGGGGNTGGSSVGGGNTGGGGDTGGGSTGGGAAGGGATGGAPILVPGFDSGNRVALLTLQSPWFDVNFTTGSAVVTLDSEYRLESIGLCPVLYCLGRNTAQVVDAGYNSDVSWGRWINGTARLTTFGFQRNFAVDSNNGMHYLVGVPTASMPTSGSAYYAMAGATSPTFASGAVAPGTFTGQGLVQFAAGHQTRVAFKGDMVFGSGERYHLFSNGAKTDSAGRLSEIGATQIEMTGRSTFRGNIGVVSQGGADRLGCASSNCQAEVQGGFYGAQAARMGVGYTVGRTSGGGDTINGVAVLNRE